MHQLQLSQINDYINSEINFEIEDFVHMQSYFAEHIEDFKFPYKYSNNAAAEWYEYEKAFKKEYPGEIMDETIQFNEMSENVKLLYAKYYYKKILLIFDAMREKFGLDYAYYVYYTGKDDKVCYMFDGPREETIIDGESFLTVGLVTSLDRKNYANAWKAYETGKPTGIMDSYRNEYGHEYTYTTPVIYDGKVLGLILLDINFNEVENSIFNNILRTVFIYLVVFGICSAFIMTFIKNQILLRIAKLEKDVTDYSENKDPAIAEVIAAEEKNNDEIGSLANEFSDMIVQLRKYTDNLVKVTAEKERIGTELKVATEIQVSMLPRIFPPFPERKDFSIFATMNPAKEVGGDFYDFYMIDDNHIALVMADVSGKGVPAALFMAISKVIIKDNALNGCDPAKVLMDTNQNLCEENDTGLFVTVWLGIVDISTGELTFVDAGHEYPVLMHNDGTTELIQPDKKRPPLAAIQGIKYKNSKIFLKKGETLFLYTDGVPEATSVDDELYGMERLENILRKNTKTDVNDLLPVVRADVDKFVNGAEQFDDITMLAFRLEEI